MRPDLPERLAAIPWSDYRTAYGNAASPHAFETAGGRLTERWGSVADQLLALASADRERALEASHHLWSGLCHQHAYVSSAAVPALPFLLEILDEAPSDLAVEILDIVTGLALCSVEDDEEREEWARELRARLVAEREIFERLAVGANEDVADCAKRIAALLG